MTPERHAVYFAPPDDHALWRSGCAWLGRDAQAGHPPAPPAREHVAAPWRYGFHATLKAPMTLAAGVSEHGFVDALRRLAADHRPFPMPPLHVATLRDFVALRPCEPLAAGHPLRRLADDCVVQLDAWRAPAGAAEQARLVRPGQSARERENVERYGYAHVLDDWRFHMTLSDPLADATLRAALQHEAQRHFAAALAVSLVCDSVCVFVEPGPGAPFELRHRVILGS